MLPKNVAIFMGMVWGDGWSQPMGRSSGLIVPEGRQLGQRVVRVEMQRLGLVSLRRRIVCSRSVVNVGSEPSLARARSRTALVRCVPRDNVLVANWVVGP